MIGPAGIDQESFVKVFREIHEFLNELRGGRFSRQMFDLFLSRVVPGVNDINGNENRPE
eukprot:CAMPEP_0197274084 /NCGR_PEP_ID=MMETSP1432-20130617/12176_1 /TAXON_ID=44447 /ORGANISM="Pseudo-nitzschia delicatissima, Strain UNC1205" /LENGTH=58 /DNA_ID=CAMNT_0042739839 /DNA_START=254 /DNA_END=427 /DNA_ORIENTATION=-